MLMPGHFCRISATLKWPGKLLTIPRIIAVFSPRGGGRPPTGNMGDTCRGLMSEDERAEYLQERKIGPMTRRFQHLLAASQEEVCGRAVRLVLFAKSKEVPVNYGQLQNDLFYWSDSVRVRWAKSFWQVEEKAEDIL
jgi:hypothetical protein